MTEDIYQVKLDEVFEGPMDLLVHLIKRNEVDISDIPIALITKQYLEYLEWLKAMNIDVAGDFLVLAATLAHIKSRMLIPAHEGDTDEEDPRSEITGPLVEYLQMKYAAEDLAKRHLLGNDVFIRATSQERFVFGQEEQLVKVGLFELIDAFKQILEKAGPDHKVDVTADTISVKDRIAQIVEILEQKSSLTFEELFIKGSGKSEIIVTFLAILEMVKVGLIQVAQHVQAGIIRIFYL